MRRLGKGRFRFFQGQRGLSLIEVLIAVAIFGAIGVVYAAALDTNSRATRTLDEQVVAVNLATSYLEAIKEAPYSSDNYSAAVVSIAIPPQYSVAINIQYSDNGTAWVDTPNGQHLEKITITVSREGGKPVLSLATYKVEK